MAVRSGTAEVGEDPVLLFAVPEGIVLVKNLGGSRVFLGGADVGFAGEAAGYPLDVGESQALARNRGTQKESPVVPAPPDDLQDPGVYGRTGNGNGTSRVAWITAG